MKNKEFPVNEIGKVAEKESWRKEINRPIYHIHKWWAQRLGTVFRAMLLYLSESENRNVWESFYEKHDFENLVVFDPFMGSGTTVGEAVKLGMKAIGCDINPISSFLVKQELTQVPTEELKKCFKEVERNVAPKIKSYYRTRDSVTGEECSVLYYFWVKIVNTPEGEEIPLFSRYVFAQNAYPAKKPKAQILCPKCWNVFEGRYNAKECSCPKCFHSFNPQEGNAKKTTVFSSSGIEYKIKDLVPKDGSLLKEKMYALLMVDKKGNKKYQSISDYDIELFEQTQKEIKSLNCEYPRYEVKSGYNTDQAIGYNYHEWKDFFNDRQRLCLCLLLEEILKIENTLIREQFLCLFSSTLEFNNNFCSYKGEGTGAVRPIFSNHILKPERTPLENSVWGTKYSSGCFSTLFESRLLKAKEYLDKPFEISINDETGKTEKIISSEPIRVNVCDNWNEFSNNKKATLVLNGDSANTCIPDSSVDFVVTDPPYFDFIHYSELSDFFYAWLSPVLRDDYPFFSMDTSRRDNEVQQIDATVFSDLLGRVFKESNRVLKAKGKLAFSFHHSRKDGWIAIAKSLISSDFYLSEVFPVHAELMASTPKAGAKEPISIDAMMGCGKEKAPYSEELVRMNIQHFIDEFNRSEKDISQTDLFVICASQELCYCVNERLTENEIGKRIEEVYNVFLAQEDNTEELVKVG